jgi:DNA-nicking Smr family endonuclease
VGLRLVLVITGKGRPGRPGTDADPPFQRVGALRHQVPLWLRQPPLATAVLQLAEAHLKHGGAGAFYLYLRRPGRGG